MHNKIWTAAFKEHLFSKRFTADGMECQPSDLMFNSLNNPYGACEVCGGSGKVLGISEDLVIPDKSRLSTRMPCNAESAKRWVNGKKELIHIAPEYVGFQSINHIHSTER